MQAMDPQIDTRSFTDFDDLFFDILFGFGYHFLNSGRVNSTILNQSMQGQSGYFPPTGSNPEIIMASGVSSTTISTPVAASNARIFPAFSTDNFTLDVVAFDIKHRYTVFNRMFGGCTLNGI
jgi:hypothetical protein